MLEINFITYFLSDFNAQARFVLGRQKNFIALHQRHRESRML